MSFNQTYKVVISDFEDTNFKMEFTVTRDAWEDATGPGVARNTGLNQKMAK